VHPLEKATIGELWRRFDSSAHPLVEVGPATSRHSARRPPPGSGR
jgi:hypothetical protein